MTNLRTAAQQALEALETRGEHHPRVYRAIEALDAALAEPTTEDSSAVEPAQKPGVPETNFGNMVPVGWLEPPHGAFRANPLYKTQFPSQLLSWQIPVFAALAEPVQEPVQEPVANNPDPYHLSRILHELAGAASMCWEHVDRAGVFQSTQAAEFVAAAIDEIRQRMKDAPPQRPAEPVGVVTSMVKGGVTWHRWPADMPDGTPLYAAPPQRKPLSEEELKACLPPDAVRVPSGWLNFARAVEAAHGIK